LEIEPWIFQTVASSYTNYTNLALWLEEEFKIHIEPSGCSLYALQMDESMAISDTVMNKMVSQEYMARGNADSSAIKRDRKRH
jgi:hypothetical protein